MRSQRHVPQIGFGIEIQHRAERGEREIHQFPGAVRAELARAMNEIGCDQFAADAMLGTARRKLAGLELDTRADVRWPNRCEREPPDRAVETRPRWPAKRRTTSKPARSQGSHARISETGPRLSTNCSVFTSIFCSIVSMRLLRRAFVVLRAAAQARATRRSRVCRCSPFGRL